MASISRHERKERKERGWLFTLLVAAACGALLVGALALSNVDDSAKPVGKFEGGDTEVVFAAGDIGKCGSSAAARVATLIDEQDGTVLTLGDHAYPSGRASEFARCYDPAWGRLRDRTRPVPGNHDYETPDAAGYFDYFGEVAGERGRGYYSFDLGPYWHVIALNTNCEEVEGGCGEDSPQAKWLRMQLAANGDRNVLAFWHHARFSTGVHGDSSNPATFFELLYEAEADLILTAHDHTYERFAPLDPAGNHDRAQGVRQFVVGTGGGELEAFPLYSAAAPETDVRNADSHGVLRLELAREGYSWRFLAVEGATFTDQGSWPVNGPVPDRDEAQDPAAEHAG